MSIIFVSYQVRDIFVREARYTNEAEREEAKELFEKRVGRGYEKISSDSLMMAHFPVSGDRIGVPEGCFAASTDGFFTLHEKGKKEMDGFKVERHVA